MFYKRVAKKRKNARKSETESFGSWWERSDRIKTRGLEGCESTAGGTSLRGHSNYSYFFLWYLFFLFLGVLVAAWQQATQQTVDFESKWYQQAAAIREKHKVSLSFKPCAVYCCLFCYCIFIVFVLFFVCFFGFVFLVCFFGFFNYLLVSSKIKPFTS